MKNAVLLRCDGDRAVGLGHVTRCLAIADELAEVSGIRPAFAMRRGDLGFELVRRAGYEVLTPPRDVAFRQDDWLSRLIAATGAQALVVDVRDDLARATLEDARARGVYVVVVDDGGERRLAADLAIYPPVPQVGRMDWTGFAGELRVGWDWALLRRQFAQKPSRHAREGLKLLVMMGGSDPAGLTLKAVTALDLLEEDFETVIVLGSGFAHQAALDSLIGKASRRFEIRRDVEDVAGLMAGCDLAVASFGMTAYELAAMGVPAIYLCLTEDHVQSAETFVNAGLALSVGVYDRVSPIQLASAVRSCLADEDGRGVMARARFDGPRLVDGRGASRVAELVWSKVSSASRTSLSSSNRQ